MASVTDFVASRALILQRHRHLKWKWLDPLEAGLMVLCGGCIGGFTLCVFLDVVTRTIGHPWLWLQQATTAFFAWGVFIGIAAPSGARPYLPGRDHQAYDRQQRWAIETFNRLVVLIVAGFMVWFGYKNAMLDLGSFRMPWLIPLTVYTGVVPISGAVVMLFCVEQMVNGWQKGFEGPEDDEFLPESVE